MDMSTVLTKLGNWTRKIGRWFHISKMGAGHSAATGHGRQQLLYLPDPVNYEGFWWDKGRFELDGYYFKNAPDNEQKEAAKEYHKRSCIGSMQIFRRFLEESMKQSSRPLLYVHQFMDHLLVRGARDQVRAKINRVMPGPSRRFLLTLDNPAVKEKVIKVVMGYTRKRGLLVPEWSMDDEFWSGRRAKG